MPWTLDNLLQECARNTYNTGIMVRLGGGYTGKGLTYALRFLSGINYCIRKICRERCAPTATEVVTLDTNGQFIMSDLIQPCLRIKSVSINGAEVGFNVSADETVQIPGAGQIDATVVYEYLPDELTMNDLDNPIPLDPRAVDPRTICQYADYQFLSESGTDYDKARAETWLGLFNDSFFNITSITRPSRVRYNR